MTAAMPGMGEPEESALPCCDVCLHEFEPATADQKRCSEPCREFARSHKKVHTADLPGAWEKHLREQGRAQESARELAKPCPTGKVRHQRKRDAQHAARSAERARYQAFPGWLRVYRCETCSSWHLTSNPARVKDVLAKTGGKR